MCILINIDYELIETAIVNVLFFNYFKVSIRRAIVFYYADNSLQSA